MVRAALHVPCVLHVSLCFVSLFFSLVGPGKMGSSTIQSVLQNSIHSLELDGWVNYKHTQLGALNRCIARKNCSSEMDQFKQFLHQAEQEQHNVVLSTETWFSGSRELRWYKQLFQNTSYDVTIVVAYRRYYNWLPSRYYQLFRFRCKSDPAILGRSIPPLNTYLSNTPLDHPTVHKIARVSPYFDNIQIINIEKGNLVQNFFCIILGARKTCQELQSALPAPAKNQKKTLTFDRLAQHLLQSGRMDRSKTMKKLPMREQHKLKLSECASLAMILELHDKRRHVTQKIMSDFPLICPPTNVTDALFRVSVEAERALFPDEFSESSIWNDFAAKVNTTLFCDVDIEAVLADRTWRNFLKKLQVPR